MNPQDPYGVPTGSVPRINLRDLIEKRGREVAAVGKAIGFPVMQGILSSQPIRPPDPLTTVIDRQLLIERKARAWDQLRAQLDVGDKHEKWVIDLMAELLPPTQE